MRRASIVRRTMFEGAAGFRQPIADAGDAFDRIDVHDPAFGQADFMAPDLLVPMGGYQRADHPWIDG